MLPVAILAGGLATRLRPLTEDVPKSLIEVAGRPFAEHQLTRLAEQGIDRVVFCVGHLGDRIERALGDGRRWGLRLEFVHDPPVLAGTGGAVLAALPRLGESFFVMYGDSYLPCDMRAVQEAFFASGRAGLMTVFRNENRWDRSNVEYVAGRIVRYDKRAQDASMQHIDYGLGVFHRRAFDAWNDHEGPFDLASVYRALLAAGELAGVEVPDRFYEIGSLDGLAETRALLAADREERS
jgi:NDP-sugar pyrophosphorylase family protein